MGTFLNFLGRFRLFSAILAFQRVSEHFGLNRSALGCFGTFGSILRHVEIFWDVSEHFGTFQDISGQFGMFWDVQGRLGSIKNYFVAS